MSARISSATRRYWTPVSVRGIPSQGRDATGVRVVNLDAGATVASVAPILAADENDS